MKYFQTLLAGLVMLMLTQIAFAHHSQAEFDRSEIIEMEGEITAAYWRNPHVNFSLKTIDNNGNEEVWEMETAAWNYLSRIGIPKDSIKVGDKVRVAVFQSTKRPRQLSLNNVLLESGIEIVFNGDGFSGNGQSRWSDRFYGIEGGEAAIQPATITPTGDLGLFQVWAIAGGRRVPLDGELPLTEQARAAQAAWDPIAQDPLLRCISPGMPPTMGNPYPMQFSEQDGNIILKLEEFDNVRTIYMSGNVEAGAPSPLGQSLGRWQDGSLLVETNNINYPYFNRVGVAQSTEVTTSERFTLSEDGLRLDYELTITDPITFTEPVSWGPSYIAGSGEVLHPYECTVERYVDP